MFCQTQDLDMDLSRQAVPPCSMFRSLADKDTYNVTLVFILISLTDEDIQSFYAEGSILLC